MSESAKRRCTPEWRAKKSQAYSTPLPVDEVRRMYEGGMSQSQIATQFGVTQKVVHGFMRRNGIEARKHTPPDQTGDRNPYWKGDAACYAACHKRVESAFGRPRKCEVCGIDDTARTYEWANLTGDYPNVDDYQRMCRQCHRRYDKKRREDYVAARKPV